MNTHQKIESLALEHIKNIAGKGPFHLLNGSLSSGVAPHITKLNPQQMATAIASEQLHPSQLIYRDGLTKAWTPIDKTPLAIVLTQAEALKHNHQHAIASLQRASVNTQGPISEQMSAARHFAARFKKQAPNQARKHQSESTSQSPFDQLFDHQDAPDNKMPALLQELGIETQEDLSAAIQHGFANLDDNTLLQVIDCLQENQIRIEPNTMLQERQQEIEDKQAQRLQMQRLRNHPGFMSDDVEIDRLP